MKRDLSRDRIRQECAEDYDQHRQDKESAFLHTAVDVREKTGDASGNTG